jgi:hypothetical protein
LNKAVLNSMTKTERRLVSETEREALVELDEDALLELHSRVRRARTKHVKNYRRAASARVVESGSRGIAYPKNQRDRDKAEVFELALARVSRQVEVKAKPAAAELRAERLQAARAAKATPGLASAPAPDAVEDKAIVRPRATKTTGGLKRDASPGRWALAVRPRGTVAETVPAGGRNLSRSRHPSGARGDAEICPLGTADGR